MTLRYLLLVVLLAAAPALQATADEAGALEEIVVQMASTPEQHTALAGYYRGKAATAREGARRHREMAKRYMGSKHRSKTQMQAHCNSIASAQDQLAKEYEELASLHDQEAH